MTLADRPSLPPERPAGGCGRSVLLLLILLVAAATAGFFLLLRPHLVFTNTLAGPVRLLVGEDSPRTVLPGASSRIGLAHGRTMVAQWELVRPLSADGQPMGEDLRGSTVLRDPSGTLRAAAARRTGDDAYFAPLITNASTRPLRITVNAGLQGAVDCGCAVRPGGRRVFIGYYRLYQNSSVRARVSGGGGEAGTGAGAGAGAAEFRDLGRQVTRLDGTVGLRFEDKDLQ